MAVTTAWILQEGSTDAQYNSARILRHLAMGGSAAGKQAAYQAIPALVHSLKVPLLLLWYLK